MSKLQFALFVGLLLVGAVILATIGGRRPAPPPFISQKINPRQTPLRLYWKDEKGRRFGSLLALRQWLARRGETLLFAMNGGMFKPDFSPQGLFIEHGKTVAPLDTAAAAGNFYLKPNGVFYLTAGNEARICRTEDFANARNVAFATQSGPMLVFNGRIHPAFARGSANRHIRNGVGVLADGRVLFAMSTAKVSLFAFADYFKQAGCRNALYLDGFVSRTYAPAENWTQTDGDFGVIIGVTAERR